MKILFINLPYYGHVIPTFGLVKELIRTGNQVTYLMPFDKGGKRFFKKCFEAFKNENVNVILSVGNSVRLSRLVKIPDNVMVYPYVPQLRVLKSSAVFITHGGMNSISEALSEGVPMIVIPFMSDQPTNARRIEELELGVQMSYKKLTSDALRTTVNSLLKNECIRSNVKEMQQEMLNCPGNGAGVKWIMKYYQAFDQ